MIRVLCTALGAEAGPHFDMLRGAGHVCDVVDRSLNLWDEDQLISAIQGYHAIIAGSEPFTQRVLKSSPGLRVLARTGVGFDAIHLPTCEELQIVVATTPGVNHHAVAEHTISLLMGVARGFPAYDQEVRRLEWTRISRPRVMGSTLGIIGLGRIGQAVLTRAVGLGMNVLVFDPFAPQAFVAKHDVKLVSLDELLAQSDYVTLHSPLTAETKHLINAKTLARMKQGSVVINTARGALVDEAALIASLKAGHLRAAGLDVFEVEPLPADSPLLTMDNVLLSGHVAGLDNESHNGTYEMSADTILQLLAGQWPGERIQNLKSVTGWKW
ncbi:MAG: phosphoglycerate dehydrogenase [Planctomycetaceae bacterium]|nr:phosphoglycerate dehydrogenase [Planctomycetaceae bacterium]